MGVAAQGLEIEYLRTFWEGMLDPAKANGRQWDLDNTLLCGLRLNVLETSRFLHERRPTLEEFVGWILERNGGAIEAVALERLRGALNGEVVGPEVSLGSRPNRGTRPRVARYIAMRPSRWAYNAEWR